MGEASSNTVLGDYVRLQRGNTYKSALLGNDGPVLLGLASIARNGGFKSDNLKTYGGHSDSRMLLYPGDLYVSLKDVTQSADLLGAVARVPNDIIVGRLTQDTVKLIFISDKVSVDYIYWILRTPQYREYCRAHATGTTNLGLSREDFLSFPIPDDTAFQRDFVELLQSIENKIDLNRRMNETLEAMARAIFKDWFVDFGPVRAKAEGRLPYLAPDLWALFPDALDDDDKPVGWHISKLRDDFDLTMGQSPPGETYNEIDEGLPFFQGRTDFGFRYPSKRIWCSAPTRIAQKDDTLVSVRAPVGDLNLAWEKCCIGRGVAAVRHKSKSRSFTYYSLGQIQRELQIYEHTGTVFGAINKSQFEALELISPGSIFVSSFEKKIAPLDERIRLNTTEIETLTQLRNLLLPKLMSGEIRLRDADKI